MPPAKNTILPCLKHSLAKSLEKSLVMEPHAKGVSISVESPTERNISETYIQFIIVASIPIWSALVLSIFSLERPLQKLPPPITIPISLPSADTFLTCPAIASTVASSKPVFFSPARASPLNFNIILSSFILIYSYILFL